MEIYMNYDILFTDIDGTLLRDDKTVSKAVLDAMTSYAKAGGRIVLSSGRPLPATLQVVNQLELSPQNLYVIAYNGAVVYDVNAQKAILQHRIPLPIVRTILDLAHSRGIHCHTYTDDTIISEFDTPELHKYLAHIHMPYSITEDAVDYLSALGDCMPFKLLAITLDDRQALTDFAGLVEEKVGGRIHTFFSAYCYLECCMREASKGNAVLFLSRHLGTPISKTIAVGDAANDISMLQAAGISYAMQNATEDVKHAADHITEKTNDEDGILELFRLM